MDDNAAIREKIEILLEEKNLCEKGQIITEMLFWYFLNHDCNYQDFKKYIKFLDYNYKEFCVQLDKVGQVSQEDKINFIKKYFAPRKE